ncbi:MAG: single-stranded DNA-binding protein [Candidatus Binataceae bacterium]
MSLNRAMLIGYVGQDLEDLRYLPSGGQPVASFSVATDESFTDKNGAKQERLKSTVGNYMRVQAPPSVPKNSRQ